MTADEAAPDVDSGRAVRHGLVLAAAGTEVAAVIINVGLRTLDACLYPRRVFALSAELYYFAMTTVLTALLATIPAAAGGVILALNLRRSPLKGLRRAGRQKGAILGAYLSATSGIAPSALYIMASAYDGHPAASEFWPGFAGLMLYIVALGALTGAWHGHRMARWLEKQRALTYPSA